MSTDSPGDVNSDQLRDVSSPAPEFQGMTKSQAYNLYTSHFLSTWEVRTYEFAAIIFTAAAYPETLLATSIQGIVRTVASIFLSSTVGRWVDSSPSRLKTLLSTISINRIAVISASLLWLPIVEHDDDGLGDIIPYRRAAVPLSRTPKAVIFALILALGILETLSASGNMLSMERDWVVVAAAPNGRPYDLTYLNSAMRRIDLICKLIAPILISIVVSALGVRVGVVVVGTMSMISWGLEVWCARRVWKLNPKLRELKFSNEEEDSVDTLLSLDSAPSTLLKSLATGFRQYARNFQNYFSSNVWIPSLSLAFLHLSALAYSATFITYLLNVGFSLDLITVARTAGSVVEISSTVVTPVGVKILGKAVNHSQCQDQEIQSEDSATALLENLPEDEARTETGLERLGLWGISWQLLNLVPVVLALWSLSPDPDSPTLPPLVSRNLSPLASKPLLAFILFFFISISRLGLWIYDLTTQQLTQTMIIPSQRSSFIGVEYSFVSLFELAQNIMTIILHKPEQFKWIALVSWTAVAVSTVTYAGWVWKMRGHLVHWERIGRSCKCVEDRHAHAHERVSWRRRLCESWSFRAGG